MPKSRNEGTMESCACSERQIRDMSKDISKFAFPNELDKQQCHYDAVTKLGGMLLLILKQIKTTSK